MCDEWIDTWRLGKFQCDLEDDEHVEGSAYAKHESRRKDHGYAAWWSSPKGIIVQHLEGWPDAVAGAGD